MFLHRIIVELYRTCPQMSDFEYMGRVCKDLSAQVVEKILDDRGELREGYTA